MWNETLSDVLLYKKSKSKLYWYETNTGIGPLAQNIGKIWRLLHNKGKNINK